MFHYENIYHSQRLQTLNYYQYIEQSLAFFELRSILVRKLRHCPGLYFQNIDDPLNLFQKLFISLCKLTNAFWFLLATMIGILSHFHSTPKLRLELVGWLNRYLH